MGAGSGGSGKLPGPEGPGGGLAWRWAFYSRHSGSHWGIVLRRGGGLMGIWASVPDGGAEAGMQQGRR